MKALILAGGFGTRLKDIIQDVPKPMAMIAGKPFLEHQIRFLKKQGITQIIIAVHHMSDKIKSYVRDGFKFGVDITYSEEDTPLGTAGAIKKAQKYLDDTHAFFEKHGTKAIIMARFIPIVRTFTPFVAGLGEMSYKKKFLPYDIAGGVLWISSMSICGYLFGQMPWVKEHFELFVIMIIVLSVLPIVFTILKSKFSKS